MEELFNKDGHITEYGFKLLIEDNNLNELNRLEISEHISFCEECLSKYITLLDNSVLISPTKTTVPVIMKEIIKDTSKFYLKQYISMFVAACFALIFWVTGVFTVPVYAEYDVFQLSITEKTNSISNAINELFNNISLEGVLIYEKKK